MLWLALYHPLEDWHLLTPPMRKSAHGVCSPGTQVCASCARHCVICTCVDHVSASSLVMNNNVFSDPWCFHQIFCWLREGWGDSWAWGVAVAHNTDNKWSQSLKWLQHVMNIHIRRSRSRYCNVKVYSKNVFIYLSHLDCDMQPFPL